MSLATRCAACGTVFRVVQDQLKVSEGWVRCGRCAEVFNALEGLFDLERENAPAWTPSQRGALETLSGSEADRASAGADHGAATPSPVPSAEDESPTQAQADSELETRLLESPEDDLADGDDATDRLRTVAAARTERDEAAALAGASSPLGKGSTVAEGADPTVAAEDEEGRVAQPDFLRQAEWQAHRQSPRMQAGLVGLAVLLFGLLCAQGLYLQRDTLSASHPAWAPLLAQLCAVAGCRIEAPRRIESLAVESSGLTQLDDPARVRLQVALRNRDSLPLMTPSLDLSLTDSRGELVARRVLDPRDFGNATPVRMAPGAELNLQAVLDTGERRVSGYSVEIFYP